MRYDDAKYALNEFFKTRFAEAVPTSGSSGTKAWIDVFNTADGVVKVGQASASATGREGLFDMYVVASEGSKAYKKAPVHFDSQQERDEWTALGKWQVVTKNALLADKFDRTVPDEVRSSVKFKPTWDVTDYVGNLRAADMALGAIKEKTPEQMKLYDDIKTLRSMSATGEDSQATLSIIQQWK